MSVILTRKVHFCASHREHNAALSDEENRRIFGKYANWHGHNYLCEVSVCGEVDASTGMVIDLKVLSEILDDVIMRRYDHKNLNLDVPALAEVVVTTETIVMDIWRQLVPRLPQGIALHRVRLYEDPTLFAEYFGS